MEKNDTIKLLQECDAGSKMAVSSIDDVLNEVQEEKLCKVLRESHEHHEKLGNEIHEMLQKVHGDEKEPSVMAKGMSWLKTTMKLEMESSDATIAELMTQGCDMGVKSLYQYLHTYEHADREAKALCRRLIDIEEELRKELQKYL